MTDYPSDVLEEDLLLPEQQTPTLPDDCPLGRLYRKRKAQGRDLTILIGDWNLERGSGKTTLALRLAAYMDDTDEGVTPRKATLSAEELTDAYTTLPKGSSLILDEGEAAVSNRRSMAGVNESLRSMVGMGRVEQKRLFLTTPGVHQVDRDIRNMCDVWIFVRELGEAQMFRVKYNPLAGHELTHNWGTLTWPGDLTDRLQDTYDALHDEKKRRLRGEGDGAGGYVPADEADEQVREARKEAERQTRDDLLAEIYENSEGMTQQELADAVGLSRSRVADIISETGD